MDADDFMKSLGLDPEFVVDLRKRFGSDGADRLMLEALRCIRSSLSKGQALVVNMDDNGFLIGVSLEERTYEERLALYKLVNLLLEGQNLQFEEEEEEPTVAEILVGRFSQVLAVLAFIGLVKLVFFL